MEQNTTVYLLFPPLLLKKQQKITNMDSTGYSTIVGNVLREDARRARSHKERSDRNDCLWVIKQ
jgi:hypothetical protein